jgi:hypothetical protein
VLLEVSNPAEIPLGALGSALGWGAAFGSGLAAAPCGSAAGAGAGASSAKAEGINPEIADVISIRQTTWTQKHANKPFPTLVMRKKVCNPGATPFTMISLTKLLEFKRPSARF